MGTKLEASLAILNGAVGDYLARTGNGLATELTFLTAAREGAAIDLDRSAMALALPAVSRTVAILAHGLMCTESVWEMADGADYGSLLARDLGCSPLYVRYNTGLPIAESGASLSRALDRLVDGYPVPLEEILLVGHSMGGLVIRSACHVARLEGHRWLPLVRRAVYLGSPHLGTPLERVGRAVAKILHAVPDPYTRLVAQIGDLRSSGLKNLGDGLSDPHHPVPLLPEIQHYLVAGSLSGDPWLSALFGDALVPVHSATAGRVHPTTGGVLPSHVKIIDGCGHIALAHEPAVYECIRDWCEEGR